jgi:hypothetical protein
LRNGELTTITENRNKGLSVVVTTLILLVVGVLLASVVAYYATNITTTRTNTEEVRISSPHVWVNSTGAVAAFKVQNLGGKDILLDKITVRSVETTWTQVYIYRVQTATRVSNDMNVTSYDLITGANFTLDGRTYSQIKSDVPLISGGELLVYVKGPSNIQMDDIGTTVDIGVTTNNAQYLTECNVRSGTSQ